MGSSGPQKLVTVVRSGLAGDVQHVRKQRDLSLEVVCDELGWQQSKLSRMENGHQCISTADLASLLVVYKVKGRERNQLLHLVDRQDEPGRWILNTPVTPTPLMRLEADAISLISAEPLLVPGLLQTVEYARAVMEAEDVPTELFDSRLETRQVRQRVLDQAKPPKFDVILEETVLRRPFGGSAVMARQLRALLEAADRPNVRLWVVPSEVSTDVGFSWPVYVIGLPHAETVVQLESKASVVYIEDEPMIEYYQRYAEKLGKAALNPAQSVARIATIGAPRRRSVVSPVQPGRTERRFLGLMAYPEPKGIRGQQHARKSAVVFRCGSNALRGPRDMVKAGLPEP